jgi:hypothetical protein
MRYIIDKCGKKSGKTPFPLSATPVVFGRGVKNGKGYFDR